MGVAEMPVSSDSPYHIGKLFITSENRHYRAHGGEQGEISPKIQFFEDNFTAIKDEPF